MNMSKFNKSALQSCLERSDVFSIDHARDRQIGVSTAMALQFIAKAILNPNELIKIYNHAPTNYQCDLLMFEKVVDFIKRLGLKNIVIKRLSHSIVYNGVVELDEEEIELVKTLSNGTKLASVITKIY